MSLSVDGFWKAGFWSESFWAEGFWYEGEPVPPPEPTTNTFGGVRRSERPRRVIFDFKDEIEEEESQVTVEQVKKLIARKIPNKTIAQPVQKQVLETIKLAPIDLTQAKQLVDTIRQQEIQRNIRLRQLKDDEEAIKWLI